MVRQAAGELSAWTSHAPTRRGAFHPGPRLCRRPGQEFPAQRRPADRSASSRPTRASKPGSSAAPRSRPIYDPLLAKIIVRGATRAEALSPTCGRRWPPRRSTASRPTSSTCAQVGRRSGVRRGRHHHRLSGAVHLPAPRRRRARRPAPKPPCRTIPAGSATGTSACRLPGPMDPLAFRAGNRLLGNPEGAAGLEITVPGPTLRFNARRRDRLTGADGGARSTGAGAARGSRSRSPPGRRCALGAVTGRGRARLPCCRAAASTCPHISAAAPPSRWAIRRPWRTHAARRRCACTSGTRPPDDRAAAASPALVPHYGHDWEIGVLYGPHGAPGLLHRRDIDTFFATAGKSITTPTAPACG